MILYFSATGNCRYVAERVSKITREQILSISNLMKKHEHHLKINPGESLGLIVPTYSLGLPSIVEEYLKELTLSQKPTYLWFCATYGTSPGQAGAYAQKILEKKDLHFNAFYSVKMPDTWTPIFDLSDKEKVKRINEEAEPEIDFLAKSIEERKTGDFMKRKVPLPIAKLYRNLSYNKMRETKNLHVEESCVGCGLCERNCPVGAIEMRDGKPFWKDEKCAMCLKCLHHCPKFSIQYKNKTKKHGQYDHKLYEEKDSSC